MTDKTKEIVEKLDKMVIDRKTCDILVKDRLDFGFDSIYFRYAEALDELALYKSIVEHTSPIDERRHMSGRKMHFYNTLEQLLRAHEAGGKNDINN